jgi:3-deoxy-D-manno-octulosonate 8-phosphate phosphatase (KDO 8-P phosphatase)
MKPEARAQKIKLLVFDVDGVLTDGQIVIGSTGETVKVFNVHDGLGITAAHRAGLKTAVITGRESDMVSRRGQELAITDVCQKVMDKYHQLIILAQKYDIGLEEIAYVGDDLNDLSVMHKVGLACAVADAMPEVKAAAHMVSSCCGGRGAVREIIEFVLKAQGKWDDIVEGYKNPGYVVTKQ